MNSKIIIGIIIAVVVFAIIAIFVSVYNSLVRSRNTVKQSFADLDVLFKKRYDLVPNLVNTVKGYMKHEADVLTKTTELRANAMKAQTINDAVAQNKELSSSIRNIFAISENYPKLMASQNFMSLQDQLTKLEQEIASQRAKYNACVTNHNNQVETFPKNILAKMMKFEKFELFVVDDPKEREVVKVEF